MRSVKILLCIALDRTQASFTCTLFPSRFRYLIVVFIVASWRLALTISHLLLTDNPVLCDAGLADLTVALEVNHAKVFGVGSDCPTTSTPSPSSSLSSPSSSSPSPPLQPIELTSTIPPAPLPPTLLLAAASSGNVSFAATLE